MQTRQLESVFATMNEMERTRALQGMRTALRVERLFSAIGSAIRRALRSARHAMTVVYGRGFEH